MLETKSSKATYVDFFFSFHEGSITINQLISVQAMVAYFTTSRECLFKNMFPIIEARVWIKFNYALLPMGLEVGGGKNSFWKNRVGYLH